MDAYTLLDCTILHEFFHSKLGGLLEDRTEDAYTWGRCVAMPAEDAIKNAGMNVLSITEN